MALGCRIWARGRLGQATHPSRASFTKKTGPISTHVYSADLADDVDRLVRNALQFNGDEAEIFRMALALRENLRSAAFTRRTVRGVAKRQIESTMQRMAQQQSGQSGDAAADGAAGAGSGSWSKHEDAILAREINSHGGELPGKSGKQHDPFWTTIQRLLPGRSEKDCRQRFTAQKFRENTGMGSYRSSVVPPRQQEQMVVAMEAAMEAPEAGDAGSCYRPDTQQFSFSNMLKKKQLPRDPFDNIDMALAWKHAKDRAKSDAARAQAPAPKKRARRSAPERVPPPLQVFALKFLG